MKKGLNVIDLNPEDEETKEHRLKIQEIRKKYDVELKYNIFDLIGAGLAVLCTELVSDVLAYELFSKDSSNLVLIFLTMFAMAGKWCMVAGFVKQLYERHQIKQKKEKEINKKNQEFRESRKKK